MDDVPTGQPALALAQKVIDRVSQSRLPADLIPAAITGVAVSLCGDAENDLRADVLAFMDTVRTVERAIAAGRRGEDVPEELDTASLGAITEEEWRAFWPTEPGVGRDRSPRRTASREAFSRRCARTWTRRACRSPNPCRCPSRRPSDAAA